MFLVGYFIWPCFLPFLALLLVLAILGVRDVLFAIDLRSWRRATRGLALLAAPVVVSFVCLAVWCAAALQVCQVVLHEAKTTTLQPDMHELMIDVSPFPTNWSVCIGPLPPPERAQGQHGEIESLHTQLCYDGAGCQTFGAEQRLYRYRTEIEARSAFESDFSTSEFVYHKSVLTPWHVPDGWTYQTTVADEFKFACARLDMGVVGPPEWRCTSVARYGQYISAFNSALSPDCMSLGDLARVLEAIDEHMAEHTTEAD